MMKKVWLRYGGFKSWDENGLQQKEKANPQNVSQLLYDTMNHNNWAYYLGCTLGEIQRKLVNNDRPWFQVGQPYAVEED